MVNAWPIRWTVFFIYGALLSILTYATERYETTQLLTLYTLSFGLYVLILKYSGERQLSFWIVASIVIRIALLPSTPNLTEDFYRFIWDGRLSAAGFHPLDHPPSYYITNNIVIHGDDDAWLYSQLNSANYFSVYPPIAQFLFWICAILSDSVQVSLLCLKVMIIAADIGILWIIDKLLRHLNLSRTQTLIYALNPLVLIEISGNAHYESVMIFLLLLAAYLLLHLRTGMASLPFAFSIGAKLIPLMFLPPLWKLIPRKNVVIMYTATTGICALIFFPYFKFSALLGLFKSLGYFVAKFEFNASIYYLVREIGYWTAGFNIIQIAGGVLAFIAVILILWISLRAELSRVDTESRQKQLLETWMWSMTIYLFFTTIVHPWYLTTLLALSLFSTYRFPTLWTFLIFFTYAGYSVNGFNENYNVVILEYTAVAILLCYELISKTPHKIAASSANQL